MLLCTVVVCFSSVIHFMILWGKICRQKSHKIFSGNLAKFGKNSSHLKNLPSPTHMLQENVLLHFWSKSVTPLSLLLPLPSKGFSRNTYYVNTVNNYVLTTRNVSLQGKHNWILPLLDFVM